MQNFTPPWLIFFPNLNVWVKSQLLPAGTAGQKVAITVSNFDTFKSENHWVLDEQTSWNNRDTISSFPRLDRGYKLSLWPQQRSTFELKIIKQSQWVQLNICLFCLVWWTGGCKTILVNIFLFVGYFIYFFSAWNFKVSK